MNAVTSRQLRTRWRWFISVAVGCLVMLAAPAMLVAQSAPPPKTEERIPIVVLDPGRGGANRGTQGPTGLLEKDLTLQVATEAGRLIDELLGVRVVLTRTDDSEVSLEARAELANQAGGDLFISIHIGGSLALALLAALVVGLALSMLHA